MAHLAADLVKEFVSGARPGLSRQLLEEALWGWVLDEEILASAELAELRGDPVSVEDTARGIHVEVLNATLGLVEGYRVATGADNQLEAALTHLDVAEDIWQVWVENGKAGS